MKSISAKKLKKLGGKVPFSSITKPSKPIRKRPRSKSEFARIYGSKARVGWIKSLMCCYQLEVSGFGCAGEIHNAHTVNGGMGRKADADTIIPLCANHHEAYDQHNPPFDSDGMRVLMILAASRYEQEWLWRTRNKPVKTGLLIANPEGS